MKISAFVRDMKASEMPTMPKAIKSAWLKALRSGEYGQCKYTLTDGEGNFCCLGVLQHVVSDGSCETYDDTGKFRGTPSPDWYAANGIYGMTNSAQGILTTMNDHYKTGKKDVHGASFKTIAKWIERNVKGV